MTREPSGDPDYLAAKALARLSRVREGEELARLSDRVESDSVIRDAWRAEVREWMRLLPPNESALVGALFAERDGVESLRERLDRDRARVARVSRLMHEARGVCPTIAAQLVEVERALLEEECRVRLCRANGRDPVEDAGERDARLWRRYRVIGGRLTRSERFGLGTVIGYLAIRRVEVANLSRVAAGVRFGMSSSELLALMIRV